MKIQAAVFYEANMPFEVETLDLEPPHAGEVLIKVAATGVCHSDWHLMTGATQHTLPVVPGHEGAGVVEAVGPGVTCVQPGDHVALSWAQIVVPVFIVSVTGPVYVQPMSNRFGPAP